MFMKGQLVTVRNGDVEYTGRVAEDTPIMSPVQTLKLEDDPTMLLERHQKRIADLIDTAEAIWSNKF
ncbi:hypothetical protein BOOMER_39 [Mycobacterium phage Boomer]|uniref:Uncharacterized protein n=1 Tax=Mycobacterium phage Boomer TaxID=2902893 RepID=B5A6P6_9CAUD|nr:hypothetical protein BOOMER_39 [Mycobacterium phage Boomer]ACF34101.1 hypothetical protein BOOMER_39 [Mycobacterium phage Boomer]QBP31518.1 hypothetical protein SEA_CORNUCOPIA_40 [Mycobacterium phage Cornucopia]UCR74416.1 hypothetical protein Saroj_42 [Mycobacterium phage Saroj]UZV39568.1 hypothetical protein Ritam007_42 [Mycobacterium phage Ritam007]